MTTIRHALALLAALPAAACVSHETGLPSPLSAADAATQRTLPSLAAARPPRAVRRFGVRSVVANRAGVRSASLCGRSPSPLVASCAARVRRDVTIGRSPAGGFTPADLQAIYGIGPLAPVLGGGQTVGVVVAYDDARAEADLATYRATFGLPPCASWNGCFTKLTPAAAQLSVATGASGTSVSAHPTTTQAQWSTEAAADVEMVSATCPRCSIVLAEADSNSLASLGAAAQAAVAAGATVLSASFAAPEGPQDASLAPLFRFPRVVPLIVASGDAATGPGANFPAVLASAVAVGGTTVTQNANGTLAIRPWTGTSSGCSAYVARPWYQRTSCGTRSTADVAGVADPDTGVAVYDTSLLGGWAILGGTSVAAPAIAGLFALAGGTGAHGDASSLYLASGAYMGSFFSPDAYQPMVGVGMPSGLRGL